MIILDNNVLSTFARIGKLKLLLKVFEKEQMGMAPAVYQEFKDGLAIGHLFLADILSLVNRKQIKLEPLTGKEILAKSNLPASFDEGECESLTLCKYRGFKIVTNERHIRNYCKREKINSMDLPGLLRFLWRNQILTKAKVSFLIEEIEAKDNIVFKSTEEIFKE